MSEQKQPKLVAFEVVRGFWIEGEDGLEKVQKGAGVELPAEDALEKLEAGIIKRMK